MNLKKSYKDYNKKKSLTELKIKFNIFKKTKTQAMFGMTCFQTYSLFFMSYKLV